MKYDSLSRRHFLQGVGGSLLALPLLPSLMPRAHASSLPTNKFLVLISSGHGGTGHNSDWYPAELVDNLESAKLTKQVLFPAAGASLPEHIIRHARLKNILSTGSGHEMGNVDNGTPRLSYILGSFLNPYLDKMNFIRGMDGAMSYYGHSWGVYGGHVWTDSKDPNLI